MWSDRQAQLQVRRGELVARSRALRERIAQEAQPLQRPLALVDRARDGLRWLMANPLWLVGIVAVSMVLRPRRAVGWAAKVWWGWRMWRRLQALAPLLSTTRS